ncbi:MAG: hypothetical protein R3301_17230 [Saprospiraceae bacterium]|nr:hypothetical protein [Saprospiraceae bacterium]
MNLEQLEQLFGGLESLATIIALIIAGIWTYRVFIRNRQNKPRAIVEHQVYCWEQAPGSALVHVVVRVRNISDLLIQIARGKVEVSIMTPDVDGLQRTSSGTEYQWPFTYPHPFDWSAQPHEIEPHEMDEYHFDFRIDRPFETLQVYSHIQNTRKRTQQIGWNKITIHQFKEGNMKRELDVDPKPRPKPEQGPERDQ